MNVICSPTDGQRFGFKTIGNSAEICMESLTPIFANRRNPLFCREDDVRMDTDVRGRHTSGASADARIWVDARTQMFHIWLPSSAASRLLRSQDCAMRTT